MSDHNPIDASDRGNPALIDARKTFMWTLVLAVLFIGSVALFIL